MKRDKEDSIDSINKQMELDSYKTELSKNSFAEEVRNGLGFNMKNNPNGVVFLNEKESNDFKKLPYWVRFKINLKKFFNKF
jgi:hypothetical protein